MTACATFSRPSTSIARHLCLAVAAALAAPVVAAQDSPATAPPPVAQSTGVHAGDAVLAQETGTQNLVVDGGFEQPGASRWNVRWGRDVIIDDRAGAYRGNRYALFGGTTMQEISQQIAIPASAHHVTLTFRLNVMSAEPDRYKGLDQFRVSVNGNVLQTFTGWDNDGIYLEESYPLPDDLAGTTLTLRFHSLQGAHGDMGTIWCVDDVRVMAQ